MTIASNGVCQSVMLSLAIFAICDRAIAQPILPAADGTGTIVTPEGDRFDIHGGQTSADGRNLFHSFERFGLNEGQIANFLANPNLENILGRVTGGEASFINGLIQVTGGDPSLFLLNPAGIVFGSDASLNVPADFTATTATGIRFDGGWFHAAGETNWSSLVGNPNAFDFSTFNPGAIVNEGNLAVPPGANLSLIGGIVLNTGSLQAPGGKITLAAVPGESLVRLDSEGNVMSLEVGNEASGFDRGEWNVTPLSLPQLLTGGEEWGHATEIAMNADGTISLAGSGMRLNPQTGDAIVSGNLLARGNGTNDRSIQVLGNRVGLFGATLDASGANGGGNIFVGGDLQGGGTLPRAQQTLIDASSFLNVDALEQGNGGNAIVWSDRTTQFYGNISARGGAHSGDGGFVEVSGYNNLVFQGNVDTSAPNGEFGNLLLDPTNIRVVADPVPDPTPDPTLDETTDTTTNQTPDTTTDSGEGSDGSPTETSPPPNSTSDLTLVDAFADDDLDADNQETRVNVSALDNATSHITLQATNDITFETPVNTSQDLSAQAGRHIDVNASLEANGGNVTLSADTDGDGNGAVTINAEISTGGGSVSASGMSSGVGQNAISINAPLSTAGGNINLTGDSSTATGISIANSIESGGGSVNLIGTNVEVLGSGSIHSDGGQIDLTGTADGISIGGILNSGSGNLSLTGDTLNLTGTVSGTGNLRLVPPAGDAIVVGGTGATAFLRSSDLNALANDFNSITIGGDGSGEMTLEGNLTFHDPIEFLTSGSIASSSDSAIVGEGNASITVTGHDGISGIGLLSSANGSITLTSSGGDISNIGTITSDNSPISITASIGDISVEAIDAGTDDIDVSAPLGSVRVTGTLGDNISLSGGAITVTHSGESPFIVGDNNVNGTAGGIHSGVGSAFEEFVVVPSTDPANLIQYSGSTVSFPSPEPMPEPMPEPLPEPIPEPKGDPESDSESGPSPVRGVIEPDPEVTPDPEITPEPIPETIPEPEPETEPTPAPKGDPESDSESGPSPVRGVIEPDPEVTPDPEPEVTPDPEITPEPIPEPVPEPEPEPIPETTPDTSPTETPALVEVEVEANTDRSDLSELEPSGGDTISLESDPSEAESFPAEPTPETAADDTLALVEEETETSVNSGNLLEADFHGEDFTEQFDLEIASLSSQNLASTTASTSSVISTLNNIERSNLETDSSAGISVGNSAQTATGAEPTPTPSPEPEAASTPERETIPNYSSAENLETNLTPAPDAAIVQIEQHFEVQFEEYMGENLVASTEKLPQEIRETLKTIEMETGEKAALVYALGFDTEPKQLTLMLVFPEGSPLVHTVTLDSQSFSLDSTIRLFLHLLQSYNSNSYLPLAQTLYRWLIQPLESELVAHDIDTLLFSMDAELRQIPIAALHDGEQFLMEKYNLGLIPSLNLTDTRYRSLQGDRVLAMGMSEFTELAPLPAVPLELATIVGLPESRADFARKSEPQTPSTATDGLWPGEVFLNEDFTLENLIGQRQQQHHNIIHLATHARFDRSDSEEAYIQFWDERLSLDELRQVGWFARPVVDLLVLSACQTAVGNEASEMGIAGLAVRAGVKSVLASLWSVSDLGTLAMMSQFYGDLRQSPIKAEALRQAQLALLRGEVRIEGGELVGNGIRIPLPPELQGWENRDLSHPYFWSGFTMVGSPW